MRLLDTKTLKLVEVVDDESVKYAILSHRWESEEVSFQDMQNSSDMAQKAGYRKIQEFCLEAANRDLQFAWVDTCCIDKSSSAELQEAINSMFRWYRNATICCVYLCDFHYESASIPESSLPVPDTGISVELLEKSQWFRRGWTLQELIAPTAVAFFDDHWTLFGTRHTLSKELAEITNIPIALLDSSIQDPSRYSIAERMSWARGRITSRVEDRAYSLLGIFDVNMPMLYGEGKKAFLRLQEEILRSTSDQSILAWQDDQVSDLGHCFSLFAQSPDQYHVKSTEELWGQFHNFERRGYQSITNEGLNIQLKITPWRPREYLAVLNYQHDKRDDGKGPESEAIFVKNLDRDGYFIRSWDAKHGAIWRGELTSRQQRLNSRGFDRPFRMARVTIVRTMNEEEKKYVTETPCTGIRFDCFDETIEWDSLEPGEHGPLAVITSQPESAETFPPASLHPLTESIHSILLGYDFDYNLVIVIKWDPYYIPMIQCPINEFSTEHERAVGTYTKSFASVTCMEDRGWIPICKKYAWKWPTNQRRHIWPLKVFPEKLTSFEFHCSISLRGFDEHVEKRIALSVRRETVTTPWYIRLSEWEGSSRDQHDIYQCYQVQY